MSGFEDIFGGLFKQDPIQQATETLKAAREKVERDRKKEPPPQVRCREIDGVVYVRAEDVVASLKHGGMTDHPFTQKLLRRINR